MMEGYYAVKVHGFPLMVVPGMEDDVLLCSGATASRIAAALRAIHVQAPHLVLVNEAPGVPAQIPAQAPSGAATESS